MNKFFRITIAVFATLATLSAYSEPSWRAGAAASPYHFYLKQEGDLGDKSYSSIILPSYRFLLQKQNQGWIWNNELNFSLLNFKDSEERRISLYDFHTGLQWRGLLAGLESSKNLFLDSSGNFTKPKDIRSYWFALGYRYTPEGEYWRAIGKVSTLLASSVTGETVRNANALRLTLAFEQIGVIRAPILDKYSWTLMPFIDAKKWWMDLENKGNVELNFFEYGLVVGLNRLF